MQTLQIFNHKFYTEIDSCQNFAWKFLLTFLAFKSLVVQGKIEKVKEYIAELQEISKSLRSPVITEFIDFAEDLINNELKRKTGKMAALKSFSCKKSKSIISSRKTFENSSI